jgi:hypothetical protein
LKASKRQNKDLKAKAFICQPKYCPKGALEQQNKTGIGYQPQNSQAK